MDPALLPALQAAQETSREGLTDFAMEIQVQAPNRQGRWLQVCARPRRAEDGQVVWDGVATDITVRKQAEQASLEAERRLADIIEFLPDATFVIDQDKRVVAWNRGCELMTGVKKESILGQSDYAYAEPFFGERRRILIDLLDLPAAELEAGYKYILRKGDMIYAESFIPRLNQGCGAHLWGAAAPLYDRSGQRCGAIEVIRDVTDQMRVEQALRESELKHRMLFETAGDAILLMRGDQFIDCNARSLSLFGCGRERIVGAPPYAFSPPRQRDGRDSTEKAREKIQLALTEGPQFFEWEHCRLDRTPFMAEVSLNRLDLEGETVVQAIVRDITQRKHSEELIRQLNRDLQGHAAELERRVEERTAELAEARNRAEAADRLKSAFLATMSHELRTPLNSIIGFTGILLQGLAGPLNPEQNKQLDMVRGSARHLLALINDVLDISKIEAGQLEVRREPFDLRASIDKVVAVVKPLAEKKGLTVHAALGPEIHIWKSDQRRVEQILINLLNNAIKFTERGGIRLEARQESDALRISVSDTGIGILKEDLEKLFQPFRQIDTGLARHHEGTGLGLAICRRLADLLGGQVNAESESGKGSTFTLVLPRYQE